VVTFIDLAGHERYIKVLTPPPPLILGLFVSRSLLCLYEVSSDTCRSLLCLYEVSFDTCRSLLTLVC